MSSNYKLRQALYGHEGDVKSVFVLPESNSIISASRDLSVRLWKDENKIFNQVQMFQFHNNYVSVVHFVKPNSLYPEGVILSAGYDQIINGYFINSTNVEFSLSGHTNTVTSISNFENGDIISGSMDGSAILWDVYACKIKVIFKGHKLGIWALQILSSMKGHFLTASADKDIFLWNKDNDVPMRKFSGHIDCVRGLVEVVGKDQFLSCSNDASIRLWSLQSGSCLREFEGHPSYVYSMAWISHDRFASCGEDSCLCIWSLGTTTPIQKLVMSSQSVWSVSMLNNGDIVTGSCDGIIRIYSEDESLQTGVEPPSKVDKKTMYESAATVLPSVGIEQLSLSGTFDGQLMKVRDEGSDILYEWSSSKESWLKLIILANPPITKSHDYQFCIDIKDGEPPLKLPYNIGEDPWVVAQKFLDDNDISPMFLDQVVNFILENTDQKTVPTHPQNDFCDPFTGGSRYVPASVTNNNEAEKQFPHLSYVRYDQINSVGLSKKLCEIASENSLPAAMKTHVENIQNLSSDQASSLCEWVLEQIPTWPDDQLFPLIDILRLLVRESVSNDLCFTDNEFLAKLLCRITSTTTLCNLKGNIQTIVKLMVNAFLHIPGENLMYSLTKQIAESFSMLTELHSDKGILVAMASWLLNMSISINLRADDNKRLELLDLCFKFMKIFEFKMCPDAVHRLLVTLGTLVCESGKFEFRQTLTIDVWNRLGNICKKFDNEVKWGVATKTCSNQLELLISALDIKSA